MIDSGAVELQRDGAHYWIDPIELTDTNAIVMGEIVLAGVAAAGRFSKATSGGLSTAGAKTATSSHAAGARQVVEPTSITGYTKHGLERVMNKDGSASPGRRYATPSATRLGWRTNRRETRSSTSAVQPWSCLISAAGWSPRGPILGGGLAGPAVNRQLSGASRNS